MRSDLTLCAKCRLCEGAGYQAPPALFTGNKFASVLVIAQNPGEMKSNQAILLGQSLLRTTEKFDDVDALISAWYEWDFKSSRAYAALAEAFGFEWLESGHFCFTNAVRCRTIANEKPSDEMFHQCQRWTKPMLYGRKLVITVGKFAESQIDWIVEHDKGALGKFGRLYIPHYATWGRTGLEVTKVRAVVLSALEKYNVREH